MQISRKKQNKKGFTLIELMLAVAFLGTLLLSVAMLAMRLVDMYTKGATMRAINSVGSAIIDDMRSQVTSSTPWASHIKDTLVVGDNADNKHQYYRVHTYTVGALTPEAQNFVDYGAFCTNSYTYIFNYQAAMLRWRKDSVSGSLHDLHEDDYIMIADRNGKMKAYALARIKDVGCGQFKRLGMNKDEFDKYNAGFSGEDKLTWDNNAFWQDKAGSHFINVNDLSKDVVVLLDGSQSDEGTDLQLYDMSIMAAVQSDITNQTLYDISFVLGTTRGGINVKSSNNYCQKNSKASGDADIADYSVEYCSVNRFEFVVRQTGEKE